MKTFMSAAVAIESARDVRVIVRAARSNVLRLRRWRCRFASALRAKMRSPHSSVRAAYSLSPAGAKNPHRSVSRSPRISFFFPCSYEPKTWPNGHRSVSPTSSEVTSMLSSQPGRHRRSSAAIPAVTRVPMSASHMIVVSVMMIRGCFQGRSYNPTLRFRLRSIVAGLMRGVCALLGSNQRPFRCERNALPLS